MKPVVTCSRCGYRKTIERPEGGQTLGGTAGWYAARHVGSTGHRNCVDVTWGVEQ